MHHTLRSQVIIAEDNVELLGALEHHLSHTFDVVPVRRPEDIFSSLQKHPKNCAVILDLGFHDGIDGCDALRLLRDYFPSVRVIAMSATWDEIVVRNTALALGAHAYLKKPLDLKTVASELNSIFEEYSANA